MSAPSPRKPPTTLQRALGGLLLGGGVLAIYTLAVPATPRDFEARVDLHSWREGRLRASGLTVRFERGGEVLREVSERFTGAPPTQWSRTLSTAPGSYEVSVQVQCDLGVRERRGAVTVRSGEPLELPAPRPE